MPSPTRFTFHVLRFALLLAFLFSAVYVLVAFTRILYPYDIDFIEDGMLMQSLRAASGQPVYAPPSVEFTPHVYMPLYMWLGGLLFKFTGPSYVPLRLLSFGATLATALMIYRITRRESGRRWLGLACAGLWLGGYRIADGWYELARVDSLFVALSLCGLLIGIDMRASRRGIILAALAMALAFLTKQTGVIFATGLAIYLLMSSGRRAGLFVGVYGALVIASLVALNVSTQDWFSYYVFRIAASNPVEAGRVVDYVRIELFGLMAGLSLVAAVTGWLCFRRSGVMAIREQPWLIGIGAAVAISGLGRASVGGAMNNLMPAYALLCLSPALLMKELAKDERRTASAPIRPSSFVLRLLSHPTELVAALIILQFALGVYNPLRFIPSAAVRQAADRLIARIAATPGEVFVMMHPYYALLAGKTPSAQIAAVWHSRGRGVMPLPDDLVERIEHRYYAAVISDETPFEIDPPLAKLLEANYSRQVLPADESPPTLTGMFARPAVMYVPRGDAP